MEITAVPTLSIERFFFLAVRKNISEYALDKYIVGIH